MSKQKCVIWRQKVTSISKWYGGLPVQDIANFYNYLDVIYMYIYVLLMKRFL